MYLHFVPSFFQRFFPDFTWRRKTDGRKVLYLTFDDGPVPEITPFVLQTLKDFSARATFFCVGDNIRKYPEIFLQLLEEGHRVGNHSFHHLNGLKESNTAYWKDIQQCREIIKQFKNAENVEPGPMLFRPPYGRIRRSQYLPLLADYQLIMWDVLSADYDSSLSPEKCLEKSVYYSRKGSIIVFHDNPKAFGSLKWVLPRYLAHFSAKGYTFEVL